MTAVPTVRLELASPLDGIVVPLARVPDAVFAQGLMGPGIAIEPLSSVLCAPCAGTVVHLPKSQHALTLRSEGGVQILMHIGIDTVGLAGEGFVARVREGEQVRRGQPLIEFAVDAIAARVPSLQTMVIAIDPGASVSSLAAGRVTAGEGVLFVVASRPDADAGTPATTDRTAACRVVVGHQGGLHARPAALVQRAARSFPLRVTVRFGGRSADARSVVALMTLGVDAGQEVDVVAEGDDAEAAAAAVAAAVAAFSASGHGEAAVAAVTTLDAAPAAIAAAPGIAVGTVVRWSRRDIVVPCAGGGIGGELERLAAALQKVRGELAIAVDRAEALANETERDIFAAHLALADDSELISAAEEAILAGQAAGFAWRQACLVQAGALRATGNPLLAERVGDLLDVEFRMLQAMGYAQADTPELVSDSILVCEDLTPAQFSRLDRHCLAGIATVLGGATSHVAIMARALGIPALVAAGPQLHELLNGQTVILDGNRASIEVASDQEQIDRARATMAVAIEARRDVERSAQAPASTRDEVVIEVAANIGSLAEARQALANGADGIGLLRTELLFMERSQLPAESEQQALYAEVLQAFGARPVTIRTLDIGGDKEAPYLRLPAEANPALGLRGVRLALIRPDAVDGQLRAILGAAANGRLRLLLPMVADLADLRAMRRRIEVIANEVAAPELPEIGVMIEVPSAALLADRLAAEVDFLSVGTNDLSQYALAIDRGHPNLSGRLDPLHPAVLQLIEIAATGAARQGKWIGVCGGMAADLDAVPILLGLGITELSVGAGALAQVKARVRSLSVSDCQRRVAEFLRLDSAAAVRDLAARTWPPAS